MGWRWGCPSRSVSQVLVNQFLLGVRASLRTECSAEFQNSPFSPLPVRITSGFFCNIYSGNPLELLEANLIKSWGSPRTGAPWGFCLSELSTRSLQKFINECSGFPAPTPVPTAVSVHESALVSYSLYSSVSLSKPGGSGLSRVLTSLKDPSRVVNFSVCSAFYLVLRWSGDFQVPFL